MSENEAALLTAYGEAVLHSHLLEDSLKSYLFDCAFFKRNCMAHVSEDRVKRASFEDLIDMIPLTETNELFAMKLTAKLHLIRKIRNLLVHGFIHQIHKELPSETGRDQIAAMLRSFSSHAHEVHGELLQRGKALQQHVVQTDFMKIFDHPDHLKKEGTVAASDIQRFIESLNNV